MALQFTYEGVNHSIPGNGGPECTAFLHPFQRLFETLFACAVALTQIIWAAQRMDAPLHFTYKNHNPTFRRVILSVFCLVFGAEVAYKLAAQTSIYLLNPCHVVTAVQLWLLLVDPDDWFTCVVFRTHFYALAGATLALAFPVLNTRLLPFEIGIYYFQHCLMLIIPVYLLSIGGAFSVEPLNDIYWAILGTGVLLLYHFLPLQIIGLLTDVNLNSTICPAISDPFYGKWWRSWAICHQTLFVPLHGKVLSLIYGSLLSFYQYLVADSPPPFTLDSKGSPIDEHEDMAFGAFPVGGPNGSCINVHRNGILCN